MENFLRMYPFNEWKNRKKQHNEESLRHFNIFNRISSWFLHIATLCFKRWGMLCLLSFYFISSLTHPQKTATHFCIFSIFSFFIVYNILETFDLTNIHKNIMVFELNRNFYIYKLTLFCVDFSRPLCLMSGKLTSTSNFKTYDFQNIIFSV